MLFTQSQIEQWQGEVAVTLTFNKFKRWLESQHYKAILGVRKDCRKCVVAQYLSEKLPHLAAEVGACHIWADIPQSVGFIGDGQRIYYMGHPSGNAPDLPNWVSRFVQIIDGNAIHRDISRYDAISALDKARYGA
jgi:hypothetical protein